MNNGTNYKSSGNKPLIATTHFAPMLIFEFKSNYKFNTLAWSKVTNIVETHVSA